MAWPLIGGNGVTPHSMLPGVTKEERNPHPASIQELRLCVQQAVAMAGEMKSHPSGRAIGIDTNKLCAVRMWQVSANEHFRSEAKCCWNLT